MVRSILLVLFLIISVTDSKGQTMNQNLMKNYEKTSISKFHGSNLHQINDSIGIIYGYLSDTTKSKFGQPKNVYYLSVDYGFNWVTKTFPGYAWIYTVFSDSSGKIWMGGSDNKLYYSDNYGDIFISLGEPLDPKNRITSIFMKNGNVGTIGGLSGDLVITGNNWKTVQDIMTPLESGKYTIPEISSGDKFEKVILYEDFLIVNQNDHIYYSNSKIVDWKMFYAPISDFDIVDHKFKLFGLDNWVYEMDRDLCQIRKYKSLGINWFDDIAKTNNWTYSSDLKISGLEIIISSPIFVRRLHLGSEYNDNILKYSYDLKKGRLEFTQNDKMISREKIEDTQFVIYCLEKFLKETGFQNVQNQIDQKRALLHENLG